MSTWHPIAELWVFLRVRKQRRLLALTRVLALVGLFLVLAHASVPASLIDTIL